MHIGKQIAASFGVPVALTIAMGAISIGSMRMLDGATGTLAKDSLPGIYEIGRLAGMAKDVRGAIRGHITASNVVDKKKAEERTWSSCGALTG